MRILSGRARPRALFNFIAEHHAYFTFGFFTGALKRLSSTRALIGAIRLIAIAGFLLNVAPHAISFAHASEIEAAASECPAGMVDLGGGLCVRIAQANTTVSAFQRLFAGLLGVGQAAADTTTVTCVAGYTNCGGKCVNRQSDNSNCGTCGTICPTANVCSSGSCTRSCPSGGTNCSGTCVSVQADVNNCGSCGHVCAGGQICSAGTCTTPGAQTLVVQPINNTTGRIINPAYGPGFPFGNIIQVVASSGSVNYSIAGLPSWLSVSPSSGTATTSPTNVTFSLTAEASTLAPGQYSATITITNTDTGAGTQTITVSDFVAPVLSVSPTTTTTIRAPQGGSFSPSAIQFKLTSNGTGGNAAQWTISGLPSWLTASSSSGSADTTGTTVTFTYNNSVSSATVNTLNDKIQFRNVSTGVAGFSAFDLGDSATGTNIVVDPVLQVTPATDAGGSGTYAGPFSPASFSYQLTASSSSLNYRIDNLPSWLSASQTSGVATTTPTTITLTINTGAASPPGGNPAATVTFTNTDTGDGTQSRNVSLAVARAASTVAVTATPNPAKLGQSVTFTATASGPGVTPTGSVTFMDGSTTLGAATLASGSATFSISTLALGSHSITAVYAGDGNYMGSTSTVFSQVIDKSDSVTAVTSSLNPSSYGLPVTFKAKVTPVTGQVAPSGNVSFTDTVAGSLGSVSLSSVTQSNIAAGGLHSCEIDSYSAVQCWGYNGNGQLGDGTTTNRPIPVTVISNGATAIAAGGSHTCAVVSGAVQCWGYNANGQLGDGTTTNRTTPVTVISNGATAIAAGGSHTCAVVSGAVQCWGYNGNGQLGDGTTANRLAPTPVPAISSGAAAIAAGDVHTCAVVSGAVQCWGYNGYGELGDGTTTSKSAPVTVISNGAAAITGGAYHSCAVVLGAVRCWGYNGNGQLGDGTTTNRLTPGTSVSSGATAIAGGVYHTCAIVSGVAQCWGYNAYGQLGDGTTADEHAPVSTTGLSYSTASVTTSATQLIGGAHSVTASYVGDVNNAGSNNSASPFAQTVNADGTTLALAASGGPYYYGNAITLTATMTAVDAGAGAPTGTVTFSADGSAIGGAASLNGSGAASTQVPSLAVGAHAITGAYAPADGNFATSNGTLSGGVTVIQGTTSTAIAGVSPTSSTYGQSITITAQVSVTAGAGTPSGTVSFYDGTNLIGSASPNGSGAASTSTGSLSAGAHALTAVYGGDTSFAGSTSAAASYAVGTASTTTALSPSPASTKLGESVTFTATVTSGGGTTPGTVTFKDNATTTLGTGTLDGSGVATFATSALAVGAHSITAVYAASSNYATSTSAAVSYTVNKSDSTTTVTSSLDPSSYGQPVTFKAKVTPTTGQVAPTGNVGFTDTVAGSLGSVPLAAVTQTQIVAGSAHACSVSSQGEVNCWGSNQYGQLADPALSSSATPVLAIASGATLVTAGQYQSCAIVGGAALCWGYNQYGQLGTGDVQPSASPRPVNGLTSGVSRLASGTQGAHVCALTSDGSVLCWGRNDGGQLGTGDTVNYDTPQRVAGLSGAASSIAAGASHSCAIVSGGAVECWGENNSGQLGDNSTTRRLSPVQVISGGATAIAAGNNHTCAVVSGAIKCWGLNLDGQLGTGTNVDRLVPVEIISSGATAISLGGYHSCAVINGAVNCWGDNSFGEIGDGTTSDRNAPTQVLSSNGFAVATGSAFSCSLSTDGSVRCWGSNGVGQLDDGTTVTRLTPALTVGLVSSAASVTTSATQLVGGAHGVAASYGSDGNNGVSTSGALAQTVNPAATSTALTSSVNPTVSGQATTLTATVSSIAGTPAGSVTFMDGATTLGNGTIDGNGIATVSIATLAAGSHALTAVYGGTANYATSASSPALSQIVNQGATSIAITAVTPSPGILGQSVSITAAVAVSAPAAGTPTGTVSLFDGATQIATPSLDGSGVATFATTSLAQGVHSLTAVYPGDTSFAGSTSAAVSETINIPPTAFSTQTPLTKGDVGFAYTGYTFMANGSPAPTYALAPGSGPLPGGLTLSSTGLLSGTPVASGTFANIIVRASNVAGAIDTTPFTITVAPALGIAPSALSNATAGAATSQTITVSNGTTPYTALTVGNFTDNGTGLTAANLSASQAAGTVTLSGTPTGAGTASFTVNVTDSVGATLTKTYTLTAVSPVPVVTSLSPVQGPAAGGTSVTIRGTGFTTVSGVRFGAGNAASFSFVNDTTIIATTPSAGAGVVNVVVTTPGGSGTKTGGYTYLTSVALSATPPGVTQVGQDYAQANAASGGTTPYAYTVSAGALPAGTALNGSTGLVSGKPTTAGSFSYTIKVTDGSPVPQIATAPTGGTITVAGTTTQLASSLNPSAFGQSVTLTATVATPIGAPTGTVTFKDDATAVGTGSLGGGSATFTTTSLAAGAHSLTARYEGDGNFGTSTSPVVRDTVLLGCADAFAQATVIAGASGTVVGSNAGATGEQGEPNHAGNSIPLNSVWCKWTAPASGPVTFDTTGSAFDTTLAIYSGTSVGLLTAIAADDNLSGRVVQSRVTFTATQGVTYAIAIDGAGSATGNYVATWSQPAGTPSLFAAVLPTSRSIQTNTFGTAFAALINTGGATATGCSMALPAGFPATFLYQTTDATNQLTGSPNTPIDIGAGQTQNFVFGLTPTVDMNATEVAIIFRCTNTAPVTSISGVNTLGLTANAALTPDLIAIAATLSGDGIVNVPVNGDSSFAAAAINIGAPGTLTATVDDDSAGLPLQVMLCQSDPVTGRCVNPPTPGSMTTTALATNESITFTILVHANDAVAFDPAYKRLFLRIGTPDGIVRGSTSVAVRTR